MGIGRQVTLRVEIERVHGVARTAAREDQHAVRVHGIGDRDDARKERFVRIAVAIDDAHRRRVDDGERRAARRNPVERRYGFGLVLIVVGDDREAAVGRQRDAERAHADDDAVPGGMHDAPRGQHAIERRAGRDVACGPATGRRFEDDRRDVCFLWPRRRPGEKE
jgi:hypothetical protein